MSKKTPVEEFNKRVKSQNAFYIPELFEIVSAEESRDKQILMLRNYSRISPMHQRTLIQVFECLYHPSVKWELPVGMPDNVDLSQWIVWTKAPSNLFKAMRYVPYFVRSKMLLQNEGKRQALFVQVLESLHVPEAKLFVMMKDRAIDVKVYPNINQQLAHEAFPKNVPAPSEEEESKNEQPPAAEAPKKRGPGRPRKSKAGGDSAEQKPKRGPGRPRKKKPEEDGSTEE